MSNAAMDEVIAKIQKVLSRTTEKGASEEEAATAMRIAQKLCMQHNLDMAEIEAAATASNAATQAPAERVKEEFKGRARFKWQRQLAKYVAEANFCYHLVHKTSVWKNSRVEVDSDTGEERYVRGIYVTTNKHIFVGRRGNVVTAQLMYAYLTQAVEDNLPADKFDYTQRLSRSANSWKEGCADRLCERLAQKRDDLIKEHDAKVKAAQDEIHARAAAKHKAAPKQLEGNREVEVGNAIEDMASDAYDASNNAEAPEDVDRPDADPNDTWNPADVAANAAAEDAPGTAMVLASVYDEAEKEANLEVAHGWAPGSIARNRAEREAREKRYAEEAAKAEAEAQMNGVEAPVREETERQKQARERRTMKEEEANRRRWARMDAADERRWQKEYAKRDHAAYRMGQASGNKIGIDGQTGDGGAKDRKLLK